MALLTAADYPDVRRALDVSLDADVLPDAVIASDLYAGSAQREVLARDPLAETRTGTDARRVRTAAVLFCAAWLAPVLPLITSETHPESGYTRKVADPLGLAANLRARAEAEIAAVLTPGDVTPQRPTAFVTVAGRRGR